MKLLFATGGTGGHINPALAVAGKIREEYGDAVEILFVGTPTHMETRLVPQAGFDFTAIDVRGFYRGLSWNNIKRDSAALVKMFTSSVQAKKPARCRHRLWRLRERTGHPGRRETGRPDCHP